METRADGFERRQMRLANFLADAADPLCSAAHQILFLCKIFRDNP